MQQAGYIAGLVLFAGAMANWAGGRLTDALVRRYGLRVGRSIGAVTLPWIALRTYDERKDDDHFWRRWKNREPWGHHDDADDDWNHRDWDWAGDYGH